MSRHSIYDAIARGDLPPVQDRVRSNPAVLEEQDSVERTPLIYAIAKCQPAIARWLIDNRGQHDLETGDGSGWTALHYASYYGPLPVVEALVEAGSSMTAVVTAGGVKGYTALMFSTLDRSGDCNIADFLLKQPAVQRAIDHISCDGKATALSIACRNDNQRIVQFLLDAGADPTIPGGQFSPLNRAINGGHAESVALLMRLPAVRATMEGVDTNRTTALTRAVAGGHESVVRVLLDAGADPTNPAGEDSPLNTAINKGHHYIAALLRRAITQRASTTAVQTPASSTTATSSTTALAAGNGAPVNQAILDSSAALQAMAKVTCALLGQLRIGNGNDGAGDIPGGDRAALIQALIDNSIAAQDIIESSRAHLDRIMGTNTSNTRIVAEEAPADSDTPRSLPDCSVCLESDRSTEWTTTACGHHFHVACLERCRRDRPTCPNCRQRL